MLGSKDIDTINSSDIYDKYKDLYLREKEREEKLLQGIESSQWFISTSRHKRSRWYSTNIDDSGKCDKKHV